MKDEDTNNLGVQRIIGYCNWKRTHLAITDEGQNKFDQRSRRSYMIILIGISDDVQYHVQESEDAATTWKKFSKCLP